MPTFATAEITGVLAERRGLQRVTVSIEGKADGVPGDSAYVLTDITGEVSIGDRVILNTTAVELGLGTGGWHVVHWNLSRTEFRRPGPGHIMKLRYTSSQLDAGTSELQHPDLSGDLAGTPVIATLVHSQVGVVAAVLRHRWPEARVGYVMTDGAALPIVISDLVDELRSRSLIDVTVTAGHAFGGDLEAVTVASALALAHEVAGCDVIIVGMGPGVVGTGTAFGTTALEAAATLDIAATLGGTPILCVRASDGDERARHQGISHHSATVARFANCHPWVAAVPLEAAGIEGVRVAELEAPDRTDVAMLLDEMAFRITTMGRGPRQDPLFFDAAGAAADVAVALRHVP